MPVCSFWATLLLSPEPECPHGAIGTHQQAQNKRGISVTSTPWCRYPQGPHRMTFLKFIFSSWCTANTVPTHHTLNIALKALKSKSYISVSPNPTTCFSGGSSFLFWFYVFLWFVWNWKALKTGRKITAWKWHHAAVLKACDFVGFSSGKSVTLPSE